MSVTRLLAREIHNALHASPSYGLGGPAAAVVANTVPSAPTIGTATPGNGQLSQAFTAPASDGGSPITSYTATASPGGLTATGPGSPLVITGLTNGVAYTSTVTATNAVGASAASAASNSVTPITVAGAPTIGTATAGTGSASVAFTAPASNGGSAITGYTATSSPGGITATSATSPINVTGLTGGTSYTFTVTAQNAAGTSAASSASNSVAPTVAPTFLIASRSSVKGTVTKTGIELAITGVASRVAGNATTALSGEWVNTGATANIGSSYEVVFTLVSGARDTGSTLLSGVAGRLDVTQKFYMAANSAGSFNIEVRPFGGGANVASATYTTT